MPFAAPISPEDRNFPSNTGSAPPGQQWERSGQSEFSQSDSPTGETRPGGRLGRGGERSQPLWAHVSTPNRPVLCLDVGVGALGYLLRRTPTHAGPPFTFWPHSRRRPGGRRRCAPGWDWPGGRPGITGHRSRLLHSPGTRMAACQTKGPASGSAVPKPRDWRVGGGGACVKG